jgi:hypothetical protein
MITHKQILKLIDDNIKAGKSDLECSYGYCKALLEGMEAVEKETKDKQMTVEFNGTREEAIEIARKIGNSKPWYEDQISTLEALGLIKFKEKSNPATLFCNIALDYVNQGKYLEFMSKLEEAGLKIVSK